MRRPPQAPSPVLDEDRGVVRRWRGHRAERKRARLVSARNRRALAQWLRRTADGAQNPTSIRRRQRVLLHYRAATVRTDLLEIAALLEHAHNPDPACVTALRDLLRDDASPLYDPAVEVSELRATLDDVRRRLRQAP